MNRARVFPLFFIVVLVVLPLWIIIHDPTQSSRIVHSERQVLALQEQLDTIEKRAALAEHEAHDALAKLLVLERAQTSALVRQRESGTERLPATSARGDFLRGLAKPHSTSQNVSKLRTDIALRKSSAIESACSSIGQRQSADAMRVKHQLRVCNKTSAFHKMLERRQLGERAQLQGVHKLWAHGLTKDRLTPDVQSTVPETVTLSSHTELRNTVEKAYPLLLDCFLNTGTTAGDAENSRVLVCVFSTRGDNQSPETHAARKVLSEEIQNRKWQARFALDVPEDGTSYSGLNDAKPVVLDKINLSLWLEFGVPTKLLRPLDQIARNGAFETQATLRVTLVAKGDTAVFIDKNHVERRAAQSSWTYPSRRAKAIDVSLHPFYLTPQPLYYAACAFVNAAFFSRSSSNNQNKKIDPSDSCQTVIQDINDKVDILRHWMWYHRKLGAEHFTITMDHEDCVFQRAVEVAFEQELVAGTLLILKGHVSGRASFATQAGLNTRCLKMHHGRTVWLQSTDVDEYILPSRDLIQKSLQKKPFESPLMPLLRQFESDPAGALLLHNSFWTKEDTQATTDIPSINLRAEPRMKTYHEKMIMRPSRVAYYAIHTISVLLNTVKKYVDRNTVDQVLELAHFKKFGSLPMSRVSMGSSTWKWVPCDQFRVLWDAMDADDRQNRADS